MAQYPKVETKLTSRTYVRDAHASCTDIRDLQFNVDPERQFERFSWQ